MTMKNGDMPAMPLTGDAYTDFSYHIYKGGSYYQECQGITKREMMAMAAIQGLAANSSGGYSDCKYMAKDAVRIADALLEELERTK